MSTPARPAPSGPALSYGALLRLPTARPAFAATSLARLGYGAVSLALLLDVRARTGSFRLAGLAVAAFAVAAVAMPVKARIIDRYGQRRVLPALGVLSAVPLLAVLVLPPAGVVAAAAVAGLAAPPVGPSMRARWSTLTTGADRDRAFALDTVGEEALYVVSPALAGGLAAWSPGLALAVVAAAVALGAVGLGFTPGAPATTSGGASRGFRLPPRIGAGLVVAAGFLAALAVLEFAVTARALERGDAAWTGVLLSAVAVGSVVGGLMWGRRVHRRGAGVHVAALAVWIAAGAVAAAVTGPTVALGIVLGITGLAVSPLLVVVYLAVDARTAPDRRTEANTWVATAGNLGGAGGSALAGVLLAGLGSHWLMTAAAVPLLLATVAAAPWLGGDRWRLPRR